MEPDHEGCGTLAWDGGEGEREGVREGWEGDEHQREDQDGNRRTGQRAREAPGQDTQSPYSPIIILAYTSGADKAS